MGKHKFSGNISKLDNPERQKVFPIDSIMASLGDIIGDIAVADLGCGTGYLSIPLAKHISGRGMVYAVDINPQLLEILRQRAGGLDNLKILKSEENRFPISDDVIDVSFLVAVFHELEDPFKFVMEIRRVSKPDHRIVVVDWNQNKGEMGPPLEERISEDDVIKFFRDLGYGLMKKFTPSPYVYGLVFRVAQCSSLDRCWV